MKQSGVRATIVNLGSGRALPARDAAGRHLVVPMSCLAAVAAGRQFEAGMNVVGTVTDENDRRKLTMIRIDRLEDPQRETFRATLRFPVTVGSTYVFLDSAKGTSSVFIPGGAAGFSVLSRLQIGDEVTVNAFATADGKWTAQSVQALAAQ